MIKLFFILLLIIFFTSGCQKEHHLPEEWKETSIYRTLQHVGCAEEVIHELIRMNITDAEVDEIQLIRQVGISDKAILQLIMIDRLRKKNFNVGYDIVQLKNVGMDERNIILLHELDALLNWTEDIVEMRNTGISSNTITRIAKLKFVENKPVINGLLIAKIKQQGYSDYGLTNLIQRGLNTEQVDQIIKLRKKGYSEEKVLALLFK